MSETNDDLALEIIKLQQMVAQLPDGLAQPLMDQLQLVIDRLTMAAAAAREAVMTHNRIVGEMVADLAVDVRYLDFDLAATRRERDDLQRQLDQ